MTCMTKPVAPPLLRKIFWRKSLGGISKVTDIVHDRVCVIRVQSDSGKVMNFLSVYLPAAGSDDDFPACLDELSEILESREDDSVSVVCGDFNGDMGMLGGPRVGNKPTRQGRLVANLLRKHDMFAANLQMESHSPVYTFEGCNGTSFID